MKYQNMIDELWEIDSFFMSLNELMVLAKVGYQVKMNRLHYDELSNLYKERFNDEDTEGED
jgi:hypothetical protein